MIPKEAKAVSDLLENSKTECQKKCIADNWNQRCLTCKRTYKEIKEAYERTKHQSTSNHTSYL